MKIEDLSLIKKIIEGAIMAADKPLSKRGIKDLFDDLECPDDDMIDAALSELQSDNADRGFDLVKVASGYRFQVKQELSGWIGKLWKERAPRYSRALLETLSLIAYRQPITRGEIEEIRGVAVSSHIIKTLLEREWVKIVGHREVPGRPAIYATTKDFLDYFNLSNLDQLPPLAEIRDLNEISRDFNIEMPPELVAAEAQLEAQLEVDATSEEPVAEIDNADIQSEVAASDDALANSSVESPQNDSVRSGGQVDRADLAVLESWPIDEQPPATDVNLDAANVVEMEAYSSDK